MSSAINTNEQMIKRINDVLKFKRDAVVNIVNDKLTISVFSLLGENLQNVKEINFVIRDTAFLPHQAEVAHEFEINPTDVLFSAYDITEKNKLQHFSKARSMHDEEAVMEFADAADYDCKKRMLAYMRRIVRKADIEREGKKDGR